MRAHLVFAVLLAAWAGAQATEQQGAACPLPPADVKLLLPIQAAEGGFTLTEEQLSAAAGGNTSTWDLTPTATEAPSGGSIECSEASCEYTPGPERADSFPVSLALAAPGGPEPACNATGQLTLEVARLANEAECPRAVAGDTPRQPSTDLEELYALAEPAKEDLDLVITSAAALSEGEPLTAPLKGLPRAQEKIAADYAGDASRLTDIARASIVYDDLQSLREGLDLVLNMSVVAELKDRFVTPLPTGYRDIGMKILASPDGGEECFLSELQLHLAQILAAKEEGHIWYEEMRSMEANAAAGNRTLTPEEATRYQELEELSKELYDAAYEAAGGVVEPPAAANTRTTLSAPAFLPRYALVGARPAVADWAADGGVEVLAYDWASGRWSRDMSVLTAVMAARTSPDVHALTAAQFERHAPPRP